LGILSVVKSDVEELIKSGFDKNYISKSVGIELSMIEHIVKYVTETDKKIKINKKESTKGG
jgi:hypothetical protein